MQQASPTNTSDTPIEDWEPPAVTEYVIADVTEGTFSGTGVDLGFYS